MDENNGHQFVTPGGNTGNPHHVGLSDNITLPDGGLTTNFHLDTGHQVASHPSNTSEHEPLYHVEIAEQLKSDPTTNSPPKPHQGTGMPTPQIPAFATNISYPYTSDYTSPAETSTTIALLPQGPTNRSTGLPTSHSHAGPVSSSKPIPSSTYKLCGDADAFIPKSSPTTLYREIRIPPSESQNCAPSSSDSVFQIADALAKVTQPQRPPQAKPDIFTGDETDTKFFIWETAFDALIDSAPISAQQKLYLLYQHLDGNAKKVVEQLQYMVSASPEIAYTEARKKLKSRFGRPAIIATNFENKLANWPKIPNNNAQGLREFSDFLQQVEIAMNHFIALRYSSILPSCKP